MTFPIAAGLAIVLAYFLGAVPFAYLIVLWRKGIDIRTVGSGNVGATNAGRLLGFRYFLLIFALDVLKGFCPTWIIPRLVAALTGSDVPPWLPVLVALGTILGHNFPIYLRFRGGKGVATSLGALSALDPVASAAALIGFLFSLLVTRFVSISSVVGALCFFVVYFTRTDDPWGRDLAMSVVTIVLAGMLIIRHHKNYARIWAGTEPKVNLRRRKPAPPGRIRLVWLAILAPLPVIPALWIQQRSRQVDVLDAGGFTVQQVDRVASGHQRASRLAFSDGGRTLAMLCPRYDRMVLYRVTDADRLETRGEVKLEGRPMALAVAGDRLFVLQRPASDQRHREPGWIHTFYWDGEKLPIRWEVGCNPDDLAITPDGRTALVVTGDRSPGNGEPPARALLILNLADGSTIARLELGRWEDDEGRVQISSSGRAAAIALHATGRCLTIDLYDPARPQILTEADLPDQEHAYPSIGEHDRILMPVASPGESVLIDQDGPIVVATCPRDAAIELVAHPDEGGRSLGRLPLRGPLNLGKAKPMGLAWSPDRRLLAVSTKSGSVHLLSLTDRSIRVVHDSGEGSSRR